MSKLLFEINGLNRQHSRKLKRRLLSKHALISVWAWAIIAGAVIHEASAKIPDLSGIWTSGVNATIEIYQNGNIVRAVNKRVPLEKKKIFGFKEGGEHFTGTLDGHVLRAMVEVHYPSSFKSSCPERWSKKILLILTVSEDNNRMKGQWRKHTLFADTCVEKFKEMKPIQYVRLTQSVPSPSGRLGPSILRGMIRD